MRHRHVGHGFHIRKVGNCLCEVFPQMLLLYLLQLQKVSTKFDMGFDSPGSINIASHMLILSEAKKKKKVLF